MRSVEFTSIVAADGQISVPPEVASQVPSGEELRVVLVWDNDSEETGWRTVGRRRFEAAYAPEDSVYEELMDDAQAG